MDETEALRLETELATGLRLVLRGVQFAERGLQGRITRRPGYVLVEYRDETSGYFWDLDVLCRLLAMVAEHAPRLACGATLVLHEDGHLDQT